MSIAAADGSVRTLHPLIARLLSGPRTQEVKADTVETFIGASGTHLLVFTEDPARYRETLDLAVIVPELAAAFSGAFDVGVLLPEAARVAATRFGFRRWPAVVVTRDGQYLGAIDGLRAWDEYIQELEALLKAAPKRPPTIGIAVAAASSSSSKEE